VRHHVLDALLVADLVIDVVLGPGEQRRPHALGVVLRKDRLSVAHAVLAADRAVFFLFLVEVV